MLLDTSPPPWLVNMQRYGPPPSYPNLAIPGLNAPLPNNQCQYGYHSGGWGKSFIFCEHDSLFAIITIFSNAQSFFCLNFYR